MFENVSELELSTVIDTVRDRIQCCGEVCGSDSFSFDAILERLIAEDDESELEFFLQTLWDNI